MWPNNMVKWRINLLFSLLLLFGIGIISRLFFIQVVQGDLYKAWAQGMYGLDEEIQNERGEIFFQNGEPLAINMEWPLVYSSPGEVEEKEEAAEILAGILDLDKASILEQLQKNSLYTVIKKKLTDEEIEKLQEVDLTGIHLKKEIGRYYPQGELASQLSGFLDADQRGRYGIEGFYNEILRGERNSSGENLNLTVDYPIQFTAEKLLKKAREELEIEGGEIIVMDPVSGKILAMANFPNFDPNFYSEVADFEVFQNGAIQKIFEPGSVFKPITMAVALEEEKITPQTTYIDEGKVQIGGYVIYNYDNRTWGERTMTEVLEKSINTGAVFVEEKIPHNVFLDYIGRFGFFEPSGINLQEVYSENKELKRGYEINFATASFGQGIEITPIQLVRAYSAIANGGEMVKPYLVEQLSDFREEERVISQKTASQLTAMLVSVVENGYAKSAQIPGYYVAGKTGTAQIAWSALNVDKKGYSDKTWQSFIGFAPAFNPEFLILVKLNNPQTKTAEYSAVPIFHDLAKYIIDYYQIPPDYNEPS